MLIYNNNKINQVVFFANFLRALIHCLMLNFEVRLRRPLIAEQINYER